MFFVRRLPIRAVTVLRIFGLYLRNLLIKSTSISTQVENPRLLVSLTTYGPRIKWSFLAIESIVKSGCKESDIYLWISDKAVVSKSLNRLVARGLNVMFVPDMRSHTKYCYLDTVALNHQALGFLIADDDMIYPQNWYRGFMDFAREYPDTPAVRYGAQTHIENGFVSFSAKDCEKGSVCRDKHSLLFHPFSGSGFFIPKSQIAKIDKRSAEFLAIAPSNDDIWMHRELYRHKVEIKDLGDTSMPPSIPFIRGEALYQVNWQGGANQQQIRGAFQGLI